ncbi:fungal-specific transcription factor domain-containing protein [Boeremia exigua]|uniref:fungal-specific transcription factor domain-containing protein n=1 Tax=Boeremia exigua TaxID=749465 RepID=UPI001E8E14CC|nr:fungal-specific transcription factor domain-containing protein [Boeremia exigua]KAH6629749.1 fungal-specific transcription factor domain-containing protein [Boeremia exigua]
MANKEQATHRRTDSQPPQPGHGNVIPAPGNVLPQKRALEGVHHRQKTKVTRACDTCKAKKAKCSGEQPCRTCDRRGVDCRYDAVYARGKAPVPRRVRQDVVNSNVNAPHSMPIQSTRSTLTPTVVDAVEEDNRRAVFASDNGNGDDNHEREPDSNNLNVLATMATQNQGPIAEAPSRGSPGLEVAGQYSDTTSGLSFLHRAWRRISNGESSQVMGGQLGSVDDNQLLARAGDKPFQRPGYVQIPPLDRGRELLGLYFDVCIATYRLLHRPTVELWFDTVSNNFTSSQPLFTGLGHAKTSIVLSVLAVACIHEERARGESSLSPATGIGVASQSDEIFCEALRLTETETGFPKLESAQCRLIQVLYLLMSSRFNQAWYTFGHALQVLSALGLHRREDRKRPSPAHWRDYIEEQCKKRTFWVAYTLDKYLAVIFGRPRHYHDDDIDQDFPDAVNDEDMTSTGPRESDNDCHIESLIAHAKLAQIAERISREVYSIRSVADEERLAAAHRLGAELRQWKASLPPFLGAINPSSLIPSFRRQAMALRMSYSHAVMLAHRPFLLKNTHRHSEDLRRLARDSITECIKAAQSVLEAVDRMAREGRLFHAFWWTHYVCFCALVVVYVWAIQESNNDPTVAERRKILNQAEKCLNHLAQATATNSPSRSYSIILQELRTEAKRKTARALQEPTQIANAMANIADSTDALHARLNLPDGEAIHDSTVAQLWQPLFGSPIDSSDPGLQNFLDDWQTTDWLDLDSSAFASLPNYTEPWLNWMSGA